MKLLARLAQILGLNAVPVVGVLGSGWTNATALVLYWCETLMLTLLVALRIELHRRATNRRGHYTTADVTTTRNGKTTSGRRTVYYSLSFLLIAVAFSIGQAIFLAVMLKTNDLIESVRMDDLKLGLRATAVFVGIGFAIDLIGIISDGVLQRVLMVQLAIIIGVVAVAWLDAPQALLVTFVVLKVWTDIASQLPPYNPREAPRWMVKLLGSGFADYYRKERQDEDARKAAEEEEFTGMPMPMPTQKHEGAGSATAAEDDGKDSARRAYFRPTAGQGQIAKKQRRN